MTGKQPFEAVVVEHGATVLRVCRAVLGPADADDAWSETFLAAMRAYPDLPGGANLEAWLVTIAHRKAIDVTRAAARRAMPVANPPDDAQAPAADSPEHGLDSDLAGAVARLPANRLSPTTTWQGCPTPTLPPSSAAVRTRPGVPPQTASQHFGAATPAALEQE
jgi:DNA-directed RNA polymerase specialized sigma24 family protein